MANVYKSTDPGAPQLSGQPGSLVAMLDAVLVQGYGSGADRRDGAGWTKAFAGVNRSVYRNSPVYGTGFYLQVDDPGAAGNARYAFVRGYSSMSDFDTGLDPTPTLAALPNGVVVAKSNGLDGGSRSWLIIADAKIFYLFVNPWSSENNFHPYFFGDFISYKPGDNNNWCVCYNGLADFSDNVTADQHIFTSSYAYGNVGNDRPALYLPSTANSPASAAPGYLVGGNRGSSYYAWAGENSANAPYPHPIAQGLLFAAVQVFESSLLPRGHLPGVVAPLHYLPFPSLVSQPAGTGMGDAKSLLPVTFTGLIQGRYFPPAQGQVIFLEGGDWWQ